MKNFFSVFFYVLPIAICTLNGCKKADSNKPTACLQSDLSTAQVGQTINFSSCSTGGTTYQWTFGDGQTATTASPTHQYAAAGTYTVTLTVTNSDGTDQKEALITITGSVNAPFACLQASATSITYGDTVTFTSCSNNATTLLWDFGDGTTAATAVVRHAFTSNQRVTLTAANGAGADTATVDITIAQPARDQFLGSFVTTESCVNGAANYFLTITATNGVANGITIANLNNSGFSVTATVSGYTITIPSQNAGGSNVSGTGTINTALNTITINYAVVNAGTSNTCTLNGTRQ